MIATYGLSVLDFSGAPPRNGELLLGLWGCQERVEARRAFQTLRAIQDSLQEAIPLSYFNALCEDPEEAMAMHNLHLDRARWARQEALRPEVG